jgi:hypothetical protein
MTVFLSQIRGRRRAYCETLLCEILQLMMGVCLVEIVVYCLLLRSLVRRAVKKLQVQTAGGPNGNSPAFFGNCTADELSYSL